MAETLGALESAGVVEYGFVDVVKMAGHACPTVSAAYLLCQTALDRLYGSEIPVRGDISVTVYGAPDEGVYGVMSQVFSYITGAAGATGFNGLDPRFKRKGLLAFKPGEPGADDMSFEFKRLDTGDAVLARFFPGRVPFAPDKAARLARLMPPVVWEAATSTDQAQFKDLWMEKVEHMLIDRAGIGDWINLETRRA